MIKFTFVLLFAYLALIQAAEKQSASYTYKYVKQLIQDHEVHKIEDALKVGFDVNTFGPNKSILHLAVQQDTPTIVELLLEYNANINALTKDTGETPLMYAARYNNIVLAKLLVRRGANKNLRDKKGRTAKDLAKEKGHSTKLLSVL